MLLVLSPAKNLNLEAPPESLPRTPARLAKDTAALAKVARSLKASDLKRLMGVSDKLAALNVERFKAFDPKAGADVGKQAALAFNGDVYLGLDAASLSADDLAFAQDHVRILSGLYGLLRPLDTIQPYRLEMGTKLATARGEDLYDFWGPRIAKLMKQDLAASGGGPVVNLASDEYFSAVDLKALGAPVITPRFLDVKDGKARSVFLFVKRARGMMARFAVQNRIAAADDLKAFDLGGYRFDPDQSDGARWTFWREQPPPVAQSRSRS